MEASSLTKRQYRPGTESLGGAGDLEQGRYLNGWDPRPPCHCDPGRSVIVTPWEELDPSHPSLRAGNSREYTEYGLLAGLTPERGVFEWALGWRERKVDLPVALDSLALPWMPGWNLWGLCL
ncbi:hypothetical protein NDU88_000886 [Pleurodeles waltl]|uniref:Uncharacterized protein n=1 Tax=Pleurodeles waltl TaxID=8319 RepID=A0AAV7VYJ0_PLEWA|nr:hypothetical protein NDU88_000886 [Pleurodeles waltl]